MGEELELSHEETHRMGKRWMVECKRKIITGED